MRIRIALALLILLSFGQSYALPINNQEQPAPQTQTATEVVQPTITSEAPTPEPQTVPVQVEPVTGDCSLVNNYDWPKQTAYAVCMAESHGIASAINNNPYTGDYSVGLMQINLYGRLRQTRPSEEWLLNPVNNIQYAHQIWRANGFKAWGAYNSGAYLKYL